MILAIDGYEANANRRVGVGRFAHEILVAMATIVAEGKTPFKKVFVYMPDAPVADMPKPTSVWEYQIGKPRNFWTFIGLPLAVSRQKEPADVIFSPTHYIPRFTPIPKVMAIMDLSYLVYPELFRSVDLQKLTQGTAYAAAKAEHIITISEFSKSAIIKAYRVDHRRISVVYPGFGGNTTKTTNDMTDHIATDVIKEPYILSVGTLQPRKNFSKLIEAFSKLSNRKVNLVIVGKKGWLYEDILAAPSRFGVSDRVKFLDYVADSALPALYRGAECFVLASLYEGFGLPVLEAMSFGVPVVVSQNSSLPEIAGDAGIYIDPQNTDSIVSGLTKALSEKDKARAERISHGKSLAKQFTWARAAAQVMDVLEEVGKRGKK